MNISPNILHTLEINPLQHQAAQNIQRHFRGYMVRAEETCAICLEDDRRINLQTICPRTPNRLGGHMFHAHCAREALMRSEDCPTCRVDLSQVSQAQRLLPSRSNAAPTYAPNLAIMQAFMDYQYLLHNSPTDVEGIRIAQEAYQTLQRDFFEPNHLVPWHLRLANEDNNTRISYAMLLLRQSNSLTHNF